MKGGNLAPEKALRRPSGMPVPSQHVPEPGRVVRAALGSLSPQTFVPQGITSQNERGEISPDRLGFMGVHYVLSGSSEVLRRSITLFWFQLGQN